MVCSKNWLWFSLLFIFELIYSIKYGLERGLVMFLGLLLGITLVLITGYSIKKLDENKIYEDWYYTLGITITYEYLFGKRGVTKQIYAISILVSLPVSIITRYISPVSSQQFWLFVVPMDIVSIGIAYYLLKRLIVPSGKEQAALQDRSR